MDHRKTIKFGKLFNSIDFEVNNRLSGEKYVSKDTEAICGIFHIGNKEFNVTQQELRRIAETAQAGAETLSKAHKLGRLNR